ncbi:MAG: phosphoribosylformylglycinamidine synthase subunit PurS [Candidatus Cloacimonadota bacterium]|nr:phosphoribosylformylglycinamidine synthase subunit PurS [Candidatus Cloacimonadota bacterium]
MKVDIFVKLKPSILDPQGKAVNNTLHSLGYNDISNVRISKLIQLEIDSNDKQTIQKEIDEICDKILANPNTETYYYELKEGK